MFTAHFIFNFAQCILSVNFIAHLVRVEVVSNKNFVRILCLFLFFPDSVHDTIVQHIVSYRRMKTKSEKCVSSFWKYRIRLRTNWIFKSINLKIVCNRFTFIDIIKHLALRLLHENEIASESISNKSQRWTLIFRSDQVNGDGFFVAFYERFSTFVWNGLFDAVQPNQQQFMLICINLSSLLLLLSIEHAIRFGFVLFTAVSIRSHLILFVWKSLNWITFDNIH